MSNRGKLLVASPMLLEPVFWRAVILLLEDNDDGAFGLILNRESDEMVEAHLPGWGRLAAGTGKIHFGGPVEPAVGLALAPLRPGDEPVLPGLRMVDLEAEPDSNLTSVRVYSGYSGWAPGQLDAELEEGSWHVVDAAPDDPFDDPREQWFRILRRQPGRLAILASYPDNPELN
ncbi:MAG: YqgE/AlgH family protein [Acidimicrobiia bacterium]